MHPVVLRIFKRKKFVEKKHTHETTLTIKLEEKKLMSYASKSAAGYMRHGHQSLLHAYLSDYALCLLFGQQQATCHMSRKLLLMPIGQLPATAILA